MAGANPVEEEEEGDEVREDGESGEGDEQCVAQCNRLSNGQNIEEHGTAI